MKTLKTIATLALSATLLTACVSNKNAVITVNDDAITQNDFQTAFDNVAKSSMVAQMGIDLKNDPNSFIYLMIKDRVVNELIVKKLLDQDIKNKKIKISSEDVDNELKKIIDQVGSKEKFNEVLRQNGITANQFKHDLEEEVKIQKLVDGLQSVNISDKDAEKYYKANIAKFKHPQRVKASHILIAANKDEIKQVITSKPENKNLTPAQIEEKVKADMAQKLEKAKNLQAQLKNNPADFAKVAKENSDDTASAKQGGDLGYFTKDQMVPEFSKVAFSQKPSTVSDVVTTPFGYHIILVTDKQEVGQESFDKVKADIKNYLTQQAKVDLLQKHVDKLKNDAKIVFVDETFNPENIQKRLKASSSKNPAANPAGAKKAEPKKGAKK